ncbi:MAG: anaerobic ribonucleoside-triphosphate reductase activating protein [Atopobiaceae bacterium]|jgi:anaerobic ribonucleoside-triphosphate reductase activating protein
MNFANIKYCDIADGVGVRTSLFVSGCHRHCLECFNSEAWSPKAGRPFDEAVQDQIVASLEPSYVDGLTLLGGEPFEPDNQRALLPFVRRVRATYPAKSIWAFSGFTWEELTGAQDPRPPYTVSPHIDVTDELIALLDVLVDGPFVLAQKDLSLRFRGSSNQRIIDVPATLAQGSIVTWHDDPLFSSHAI